LKINDETAAIVFKIFLQHNVNI